MSSVLMLHDAHTARRKSKKGGVVVEALGGLEWCGKGLKTAISFSYGCERAEGGEEAGQFSGLGVLSGNPIQSIRRCVHGNLIGLS